MNVRAKLVMLACATALLACGSDPDPAAKPDAGNPSSPGSAKAGSGDSGSGASAETGGGGAGGRRSRLSCPPRTDADEEVQCGGQVCPTSTEHENDPCFVPCCVQWKGEERCGFRGTSALATECVLPAVLDPTCNDAPQFFGCCEPTRQVCGIVAGFLPGCQTKVSFATLPDPPKPCGRGGIEDGDAGMSDTDAGSAL